MAKFIGETGLAYLWGKMKEWVGSYTNITVSSNTKTLTVGGQTATLPTKTSQLTNDSGFITTSDIPEGAAASTTTPKMDGTAAVGTETAFARGDHRHPSDTSKQNVISDLADIRSGAAAGATALQEETDPIFSASAAAGITSSDITNWNGKTSNTGTVTSVTIKATSPIAVDSTAAITGSGTRTVSHANSGVTAGTYRSVTVNATGHVTAGTNPTTLSGYGITDAKIANGVITLGSNTITPLTSFTETDPTVPSWAKATSKPSYTASEVGAVPTTRTVNGKALSSNITLSASDVSALPASTSIPSKTSDLTNDSGFVTSSDISGVYKYKGSKTNYSQLPSTGNITGDVWNVVNANGTTPAGTNYAWNGTAWDALGGSVDLSGYVPTSRTVNGKALSSNISLSASDVGALASTTTIPSKTSQLTNDSGFITTSDIPEGAAASTTTPLMDGTAAVGTELAFARGDHRHPTDTSRQAAITSSSKLSADLISDGTTNKVVTATEKSTWNSKQSALTFDGTYNASTNKAATVSTVTNAINALDGGTIGTGGAGKTITALSQTNGNVSATFADISITKSQVSDFPTSMTPSSHTHGNISNTGTLTDTAAAAAGNDYVVIRDADNAKVQTSTIKGTDVADAVSKKHSHSTLTLSTTAQAYDGSHTLALPSTDPYTSARTPSAHNQASSTINAMTGYSKGTSSAAVAATDTLNAAISKLENQIDTKTSNVGTITGVTGSNGLTGSGTSGSVTISHAAPTTSPAKTTSAVYPITIDKYGHITAAGSAVTIPSAVTESTVSGWGFTKNAGTITGITMNGASKGTSGVVDLGTVITAHQDISGKADKATTLAGYGITDAKIASGVITLGSNTITPLTSSSNIAWGKITGTPTTLSGYGITDAASSSALAGYLPLSGGTMTGNITANNILLPNQKSIQVADSNGEYGSALSMTSNNNLMLGRTTVGSTVVVGSNSVILRVGGASSDYDALTISPNKNTNLKANLALPNNYSVLINDTQGTGQNVIKLNSSNHTVIGYGNAVDISGNTSITGTASVSSNLTVSGTSTLGGYVYMPNQNRIHFKNNAGTSDMIAMYQTAADHLYIGYGFADAGKSTYIAGNTVELRYGTSRTTGLTLGSDGNVTATGSVTASSFVGDLTGNASSATALKTARSIWGQNFDGSSYVRGTLSMFPDSLGMNNNTAKLWFRSNTSTSGDGYSPYIQGIYHATTGRKRLSVFQINNANYTGTHNEVFTILPDGKVGVGTTSPSTLLHVNGVVTCTSVTQTSDESKKEKIDDINISVEKIAQAPNITFKWKEGEDQDVHGGTIAQYWEDIAPYYVHGEECKTLEYSNLSMSCSIELAKEIVELKKEIAELKAMLQSK